jgi:hypothetical protein
MQPHGATRNPRLWTSSLVRQTGTESAQSFERGVATHPALRFPVPPSPEATTASLLRRNMKAHRYQGLAACLSLPSFPAARPAILICCLTAPRSSN